MIVGCLWQTERYFDPNGNGVQGLVTFQTVPEPSSIVTLTTGLVGLAAAGAYRWRRLRKARA